MRVVAARPASSVASDETSLRSRPRSRNVRSSSSSRLVQIDAARLRARQASRARRTTPAIAPMPARIALPMSRERSRETRRCRPTLQGRRTASAGAAGSVGAGELSIASASTQAGSLAACARTSAAVRDSLMREGAKGARFRPASAVRVRHEAWRFSCSVSVRRRWARAAMAPCAMRCRFRDRRNERRRAAPARLRRARTGDRDPTRPGRVTRRRRAAPRPRRSACARRRLLPRARAQTRFGGRFAVLARFAPGRVEVAVEQAGPVGCDLRRRWVR